MPERSRACRTILVSPGSSINFKRFRRIAAWCFPAKAADNLMQFQMWPYVKDMMRNREWRNGCWRILLVTLAAAFGLCLDSSVRVQGLFGKIRPPRSIRVGWRRISRAD